MKLTQQGKQALKWLSEGKEVEVSYCGGEFKPLDVTYAIGAFVSNDFGFRIAKPKLKLVDMAKLPKGTMTNCGEVIGHHGVGFATTIRRNLELVGQTHANLRIAEQTEFTYWGGGECPVPDGLRVKVVYRRNELATAVASHLEWRHLDHGGDIIGYRITGVAHGWTDDPSKAA